MADTDAITSHRIAEQFAADLPSICFAAWVGEKSDADLWRLPPKDAANIAEALTTGQPNEALPILALVQCYPPKQPRAALRQGEAGWIRCSSQQPARIPGRLE